MDDNAIAPEHVIAPEPIPCPFCEHGRIHPPNGTDYPVEVCPTCGGTGSLGKCAHNWQPSQETATTPSPAA